MCLRKWFRLRKLRRRARIYEGPCEDGGTRIKRDEDAPKEIRSRELLRFSCRFSTLSMLPSDTGLRPGQYSFVAVLEGDGVRGTAEYSAPGSGNTEERSAVYPPDFFPKLEALIRQYSLARYNGLYHKVSGLPSFYGSMVDAVYASGETLYSYHNQDPFIPVEMMRELCRLYGLALYEEA